MKCNIDGCGAHAMKASEYCFTHNPTTRDQHLIAAVKGGSVTNDKVNLKLEPLSLSKPEETIILLEDTINRVRCTREDGTMDLKTANCIGYLAGQILKAIEIADIDSRLAVVERVILERKSLIKK